MVRVTFPELNRGIKEGCTICEMVTVKICANFRDLFLREGFCL